MGKRKQVDFVLLCGFVLSFMLLLASIQGMIALPSEQCLLLCGSFTIMYCLNGFVRLDHKYRRQRRRRTKQEPVEQTIEPTEADPPPAELCGLKKLAEAMEEEAA